MSSPIYMSLKARKAGPIEGPVTQKKLEKTIKLLSFEHSLDIPVKPENGMPSGKKVHRPITVVKELDKSSPLLAQVLATADHLTEVKFQFVEPNGNVYFTITLKNAALCGLRTFCLNTADPRNGPFNHMQEVSMTFEEIEWHFVDGGITARDSFEEK